jgi:hypothetical protein
MSAFFYRLSYGSCHLKLLGTMLIPLAAFRKRSAFSDYLFYPVLHLQILTEYGFASQGEIWARVFHRENAKWAKAQKDN